MLPSRFNHVAFLVRSVNRAAESLRPLGFTIGAPAAWEGEGTLEIYVGDQNTHRGLLLLMEAQKPGAYTRAMEKRGPGLHHIAIDVLNLENYISELAGTGWLLHPNSLRTIRESRTAYLARPGMPMLIEVQERKELSDKPQFVTGLALPLGELHSKLCAAIGLSDFIQHTPIDSWILAASHQVSIAPLIV